MEKKIVLVDGSSYLFRAYHAMPPLLNSAGHPTGAIYGAVNMLRKLLNDYHPELAAVIFDPKGKTFRHALYPLYKAHRTTMPADLSQQIEPLFAIIRAMGVPLIVHEGVEADDVIGTLAHYATEANIPIIISTSDKDMTQLVNKTVSLINTMTGKIMDDAAVKEKFGVSPARIVDYLALVGDSSDNIPGVQGIGPKTAVKLLTEYGDLDSMIAKADTIAGKVGVAFRAHLNDFPLYRELLTIKKDVPLVETLNDLTMRSRDVKTLSHLFAEYEFKRWHAELEHVESRMPLDPTPIASVPVVSALQEKDLCFSFMAVLDPDTQHVIGYSFATGKKSLYVPLESCVDFFGQEHAQLVGYDIKNDLKILIQQGIPFRGQWFDVLLESYILNQSMRLLSVHTAADILKAHHVYFPQIEKAPILHEIFNNLDMPLAAILAAMELRGVLVDGDQLAKQSATLGKRLDTLEKQVYHIVGRSFNVSSPKQLQEILFNELKLPVVKKTPGGQPSTDESVLQVLAVDFELPRLIVEYRSLSKLKTTYTDKLPLQIDVVTGRIHASYHQTLTSTGRLSCSQPNLQNIPIRTTEGRKIRQAFIAPPGYRIVSADYSQIELRVMAHFSGDPGLLHAFYEGQDIHCATAAEIFDVALSHVTEEQRRRAKTINFGLIYGMSAFGLSKNLGIDRKEAQLYIDRYFERYPKVHDYMTKTCATAEQFGYVETLTGRRILIPDIQSLNKRNKQGAERVAINAPIQGTAADIIKKAMIDVSSIISAPAVYLIMQVHDELVFEVSHTEGEETLIRLRQCMENALTLSVPLLVSVGTGSNWDEAH